MIITIDIVRRFFQTHNVKVFSDKNLVHAGVLVPLFEKNGELHVILTKRTDVVEHHKGQISFPGGTKDKTDADIIDTALREAGEEIGIEKNSVEILGVLDDFCTPSGFCITPVVGFVHSLPSFSLNAAEVSEVFDVPLSFILDPRNERIEQRTLQDGVKTIYYYNYGQYEIWGATAAILRSFLHELTE
jgi:8-oxo-dGTP pyrophosphatase MutT (NUDIX family)